MYEDSFDWTEYVKMGVYTRNSFGSRGFRYYGAGIYTDIATGQSVDWQTAVNGNMDYFGGTYTTKYTSDMGWLDSFSGNSSNSGSSSDKVQVYYNGPGSKKLDKILYFDKDQKTGKFYIPYSDVQVNSLIIILEALSEVSAGGVASNGGGSLASSFFSLEGWVPFLAEYRDYKEGGTGTFSDYLKAEAEARKDIPMTTGTAPVPMIKGGYTVYQGIKGGKVVYWGMTKNLPQRAIQHGDRFDQVLGVYENISRSTARGLEQLMIDKYGITNLENIINGIGINNPKMMTYYQTAIRYLQSMGY